MMDLLRSKISFFIVFMMSTLSINTCFSKTSDDLQEDFLMWTPNASMNLNGISDAQLSPDNQQIAFVVRKALNDSDKDTYMSQIYLADTSGKEEPFSFTQAESSATQPRWSPDGKWLAFLSDRNGNKNLFLMRANGGEAFSLTQSKTEVQTFQWSPDSQQIIFTMADDEKKETGFKDTFIYKDASNNTRLWLINISLKSSPIALTPHNYNVRGSGDFGTASEEFDWSPDGKKIVFAYSPSSQLDDCHLDSSLAIFDLENKNIVYLEKKAQHESLPRFSPDGQWIGFLSSEKASSYAFNRFVAICSADGNHYQRLAPTYNEGPFLQGPGIVGWTADCNYILCFEPKGTKFQLTLLPTNGNPAKEMNDTEFLISDISLSSDKKMLGLIAQTSCLAPEAYITSLENFEPQSLTHLNQFFQTYPKSQTEVMRWKSPDGQTIEGLVTYPVNYKYGVSYPLLVIVHGGPMAFFDETFLGTPYPYPLAAFSEAGFLILRPNPRGSCGYGKAFRCANYNDWGGGDFQDIMSGVDTLIAKGIANSEKMGIMGWSYGGYMTAWAVTQTSRFKAASLGAGPVNLFSCAGTTDLHRFLSDYFVGDFWHKPEMYKERSPIFYVDNVTTPCLIQHGQEDKRVPASQSIEFYQALKKANKEAVLFIYPEMGHRFSKPSLYIDVMEKNLAWFKEHLLDD